MGTSSDDAGYGVAADGLGNVYLTGVTYGSLGVPNAGQGDGDSFLAKYNTQGNLQWVHQVGSSKQNVSYGVATDDLGNIFIAGETYGNLDGKNAGSSDAFVSKYDAAGNLIWARQLGSAKIDRAWSVSADGLGNVYIAGSTYGSVEPGISNFSGTDGFVAKYDSAGNEAWVRQFSAIKDNFSIPNVEAFEVSADKLGNVFVTGTTQGNLASPTEGSSDTFLKKFDSSGNAKWALQISPDFSHALSADGLGNVYLSGYPTYGYLSLPNSGGWDSYVSKFDADGNLLWGESYGTPLSDGVAAASADGLGNLYLTGLNYGTVDFPYGPPYFEFVAKISDSVPEPTIGVLVLGAIFGCSGRTRKKNGGRKARRSLMH